MSKKPQIRTNRQILAVAGYDACTLRHEGRTWQAWQAELPGPARTFTEHLAFLNADAAWVEVDRLRAWYEREGVKQYSIVVRPGSLVADDISRLKSLVGRDSVRTVAQFLFNVVRRGLGTPVAADGTDFGIRYFVDPWLSTPEQDELQQAVTYLLQWIRGARTTTSSVAVLLAPAGTGKTTVATEVFRRLVAQQAQSESVPVLVGRQQWAGLQHHYWNDLADVWSVGVRTWYPRVTVGGDLLDYCLSFGSLCPVFDGLDELCGLFPDRFDPNETVSDLLESFEGGRVLLTTRSRYWEENITPALRSRVVEFELEPFDGVLRSKYIAARFPKDPEKVRRSEAILDRLAGATHSSGELGSRLPDGAASSYERFDRLPYVVMLACESADTPTDVASTRYGGLLDERDPLRGLLLSYFGREEERQALPYTPEIQLEIFSVLAAECDEWFGETEVELSVPEAAGRFDGRLLDHAMLERKENLFRIRFGFVRDYLLAVALGAWLQDQGSASRARRALVMCTAHTTEFADRCAEVLFRLLSGSVAVLIGRKRASLSDGLERAGLFQLACRTSRLQAGGGGVEVVNSLLSLYSQVGAREFCDIDFAGQIVGLDLRGIKLHGCRFRDVDFAHCTMDETTRIEQSAFDGRLTFTNCTGIDLLIVSDGCELSIEARSTLNGLRRALDRFPVTTRDIDAAMRDLLRRFMRGGAAFVTRREDGIRRAMCKHWSFGDEVIDALVYAGALARFGMGGSGDGLRIEDTHSVRIYVDNGLAAGCVLVAVERLKKRVLGDRQ